MTPISRRNALKAGASLASISALAPLAGCTPEAPATPPSPSPQADADFVALSQRWLDESARLRPVSATGRGDHRFDADLDDVSEAGRQARADSRTAIATALAAIDRTQLSRDNQVDAVMLSDQLAAEAFTADELQDWAWDPLNYSGLAGGALYSLMARDFAPLSDRLVSAAARMEKLGVALEQARSALDPARVPRIHAETYAAQNGGALAIIDDLILARADELGAANRDRLVAAAESAKAAIAEHQAWIDTKLVPNAKGDFRLGALYDRKLRISIDSDVSRADLRARAQADLERVTSEMFDIARTVLSTQAGATPLPEGPSADQKRAAVAAALELAAAQRPVASRLFEEANATLDDATRFAREVDLITLPDAPVKVIEMPKFQQGVSVAYCDSPGPLDRRLDTFYAISPIPADWTDAQTTSFLREYNSRSLYELTIHEAMPGHYVQLWHSNKHPSILRAVLGSGAFIEGWACYAQDIMIEAGHGGGDPLRRLVNLKWALRVISNAILDQGVHVEGWERREAMAFMTGAAFQEEREAAGKWTRARVSSGQLATYYVGWMEHHALRRDMQDKQGAAFAQKAYHDAVLSHGSPPVRLARALLLDAPIA